MQDNKSATYYTWKFIKTLILAAVVAGIYIFWEPAMEMISGEKGGEQKVEQPETKTGKKRKIKYWVGPMTPSFHSDKPGKSPMGMDLVPVYEQEEGAAEGAIYIDPVVEQNIGVRIGTARRKRIARNVETVGFVTYDERLVDRVQSKTEGWAVKLYVDFTGQEVKKGDWLLSLYSPELVSTAEEFLLALDYRNALDQSPVKDVAEGGEDMLESTRRRLEFFDVPAHQIKELEETRKIRKTFHIHATSSGIVVKKNVLEGNHITKGTVLYVIADLSKIWVLADIYEYESPWVKEGQEASMTLTSLPGEVFTGRITYIYPYLQQKTRTLQVRMEFENPNLELKPGMYANVKIASDVQRNSIVVPKAAVIRSGSRNTVFIVKGGGRFDPINVKLGIEAEDYYEILDGLKEGDKIVTSANFMLDSESNLTAATAKMEEPAKEKKKGMDMKGGKMDIGITKHEGMKMDGGSMKHKGMKMDGGSMKHEGMKMDGGSMKHEGMKMDGGSMKHEGMKMDGGSMKHKGMKMDMEGFNGIIEDLRKSGEIVTAANVEPDSEDNRKESTSRMQPSSETKKGTKMDHSSMRHMHHEGMKMDGGSMKHEGMKMDHENMEEKTTEHNNHGGRK